MRDVRGFLFLLVLGMGYVILLWHSLSLPYNYFDFEGGIWVLITPVPGNCILVFFYVAHIYGLPLSILTPVPFAHTNILTPVPEDAHTICDMSNYKIMPLCEELESNA